MTVTTKEIRKYANKANKTFFNDALNLDAIEFKTSSRMTRSLGVFKVRNGHQSITLSTLLFGQKEEWLTTLVHELVHAWQWQTEKPLDHGWSFKQKAREIYNIDSSVVITRTRSSEYIDQAVADRHKEFGRKSYRISKGNRVWFLRNIAGSDLTKLRSRGYQIAEASEPMLGFRHCKSLNALLTARYYYDMNQVEMAAAQSKTRITFRILSGTDRLTIGR